MNPIFLIIILLSVSYQCFALTAAERWIAAVQVVSSPITNNQGNLVQSMVQVPSVTFKKNNTVGSTILVAASCQIIQAAPPSGDVTITDSVGNTYAKVTSSYDEYKPAQYVWQYSGLFYTVNTQGTGKEKITVDVTGYYAGSSPSTDANYCTVLGEEFVSAGSTIFPDTTAYSWNNGTYSSLGTTVTLTGSTITPTVSGDLIYSILFDDSSSNTSDTFTPGNGYTLLQSMSTGTIGFLADEFLIQSAVSAVSPSFGFSSPSTKSSVAQQWTILSAAFRTEPNTMPVASTLPVTGITATAATANGVVVSSGASKVITEGFVYGTASVASNPGDVVPALSGYAGNASNAGSFGNGPFNVNVTGLTANTTYYGRAYIQNSSGYSYGTEINFTSNTLAVVNAWKVESSSGNTGDIALSGAGTAAGPTAGNLLVVFGTDVTGISDNIDNTSGWTLADSATKNITEAVYYHANIPGGITTLACNGTTPVCLVYEIAGASITAPFTAGESGCMTSTTGTAPGTPSISNGTANSIIIAGLGVDAASNETFDVGAAGSLPSTGWSLYNSTYSQETNLSSYWGNNMPYIGTVTSSTFDLVWTLGAVPKSGVACIAAFH